MSRRIVRPTNSNDDAVLPVVRDANGALFSAELLHYDSTNDTFDFVLTDTTRLPIGSVGAPVTLHSRTFNKFALFACFHASCPDNLAHFVDVSFEDASGVLLAIVRPVVRRVPSLSVVDFDNAIVNAINTGAIYCKNRDDAGDNIDHSNGNNEFPLPSLFEIDFEPPAVPTIDVNPISHSSPKQQQEDDLPLSPPPPTKAAESTTVTQSRSIVPLTKRSSTWVRDASAPLCEKCRRPFSFFTRRHHCRSCGVVVCGACSSHRLPCVGGGDARVCNDCSVGEPATIECVICLCEARDTLVLPCAHSNFCRVCASQISRCALCRATIDTRLYLF